MTGKGRDGARRINRYANHQVRGALQFVATKDSLAIANGIGLYARALRFARLSAPFRMRPIEPADNRVVAQIIREVMTEFGAVGCNYSIADPEVDAMYEAYPAPRAVFYVIERDGVILGCGGMAALEHGDPGVCELRKMYFRPELRGTGMGSLMLKRILDDALKAGYTQCYLETLERMSAARHLYSKHGFRSLHQPMGNTGHSGCNSWMLRSL